MGRRDTQYIDAVYTWAGSDDPDRESLRKTYAERAIGSISLDAAVSSRRADHDELRYSLRSLEMYGRFVRNVYVVTSGKKWPTWLRPDHPRLAVVDEEAIFPRPQHLPTFNSHAVECNLHRIPGLSRHFLYFNDDMFLGAKIKERDFLAADGRMNVFLQRGWGNTPDGPSQSTDNSYHAAWRNNNKLLNHRFGPQARIHPLHQCSLLSCSVFEAMYEEPLFAKALQSTCGNRIRNRNDVAPIGLHQYYALHTGHARLAQVSHNFVSLTDDPNLNRPRLEAVRLSRPKLFCLNDDMTSPKDEVLNQLQEFLQQTFPHPSSFERQRD